MTSGTGPPRRGSGLKWGLGALIFLVVVATALAATVLFGWGGFGTDSSATNPKSGSDPDAASQIASAADTGPVTVITDDPSCGAWGSIIDTLVSSGELLWMDRDRSIPASEWNDKQRAQYAVAGQAIRAAAAQAVGLDKLTPHRVMRELYEQFIAYGRAYADRIPNYTPADNVLATTTNSAASALASICTAITDGAAAARGPLVAPQDPPARLAPPANPTKPTRFLTSPDPVCGDWKSTLDQFGEQTSAWQQMDPNIPGMLWNSEQKAVNNAAAPVMIAHANKLEQLGKRSGNPTLQDLALLGAQYRRAFVLALPTYLPADNHLANAANYIATTILGACAAVQG